MKKSSLTLSGFFSRRGLISSGRSQAGVVPAVKPADCQKQEASMAVVTKKAVEKKAVRELKVLRTKARNKAAELNHCCRCCRCCRCYR